MTKLAIAILCCTAFALVSAPCAAVIISEIDYDQPGTDSAEWVELYNPDAVPVQLLDLELVFINGNGCAEYARYDLDPINIPAGGFVVIGNHPCATTLVTLPATNAIQNGAPDVVLIEDRNTGLIVDSVESEQPGPATCGAIPTPAIDDPNLDPAGSIQLCSGVWTYATGTPCSLPACGPIPIESGSWGMIKSQYGE